MDFWKMNGAGNDFIILNDLAERIPDGSIPALARTLCERRLSLGADGLMVVRPASGEGDYRMHALLQRRRQRGGDVRQRRPMHLPVRL